LFKGPTLNDLIQAIAFLLHNQLHTKYAALCLTIFDSNLMQFVNLSSQAHKHNFVLLPATTKAALGQKKAKHLNKKNAKPKKVLL
jgi:NAD dependent epimerase/dehydratase family enzyme